MLSPVLGAVTGVGKKQSSSFVVHSTAGRSTVPTPPSLRWWNLMSPLGSRSVLKKPVSWARW